MPENSVLCEIEISSETPSFRYDDYFFLLLNNRVLAGSTTGIVTRLEKDGDFYTWNWDRVKGLIDLDIDHKEYCLKDSICDVPPTDTTGHLKFEPNDSQASEIALQVSRNSSQLDFSLVTTGDNDVDCYHTGWDLNVKITYMPK